MIGGHSQLNTFGQLNIRQVQRFVHAKRRHINRYVLGQILWQTGDIEFGHSVGKDAAVDLDAGGSIRPFEVQRYLHVQLFRRLNTLEIHMQHQWAVRVHLHFPENDLLRSRIGFKINNG